MWWNGSGWWWWWVAFLVIFFVLPLGYGWGYRGWGPWYRRGRRRTDIQDMAGTGARPTGTPERRVDLDRVGPDYDYDGWGWGAVFLWIILLIAIIWLIAAAGWGYW